MKLKNPDLRMPVKNLTSVRQLYLDAVMIETRGQEWCNALSSLRDLQELSMRRCNLSGPLDSSLTRLENLSIIILDENNISSPVPETFANLKNLNILSLRFCELIGRFPHEIFQIETLSIVDLSYNENLHGLFPDFPLNGSLQTLRVKDSSFSGALPHSIGNVRHLSELDLFNCQFYGTLPNSLSNHRELSYLDLSYNSFTGIASIFQLRALSVLKLSYNEFSGFLNLNNLLELRNLTILDLSYNNLLVNVNLANAYHSSFPSFSELNLASCNLKTFPDFLSNQSTLTALDLSNNQIRGMVPNCFWNLRNLQNLNISHNLLLNLGVPLENITSNLEIIDLHNNQLQGPIPVFPVDAIHLDYSRNKFSSVIPQHIGNYLSSTIFLSLSRNNLHGSIPDSFCNASSIQVLDISINNISGTIPSCLITIFETLGVLNLGKNNLGGPIPDMFPTSCALKTLDLPGNLLHGPIPKSLVHCSTLEVLDLGTNQIISGFPCLLNKISTIRVLVSRNNKFQSPLECSEADKPWHMLQIIDIAVNNFSGKLSGKYFATWKAMMHQKDQAVVGFINLKLVIEDGYYQDSVNVINKGQQMELVKILTVFTSIDFSSNNFKGPIPVELMDFKALHVLNFSNNALSGEIPSSIGNMRQLESLDLSCNSLDGEIPVQLASLSFLAYLNLSFNHLKGKIPTGTQLQTFQGSSFEGNDGLHGPPLTGKPDGNNQGMLPMSGCRRLTYTIDWNFICVELGFVFRLGIVICPLLFWKRWRVWYWQIGDKILCWIFPQLYLEHVTHRGQRFTVLKWWH